MPIGLNETYYPRIVNFWPHGASLTVSYAPGRLDLTIQLPMAFVIGSNQNNLAFVQYIAQILVNEPGSLRKAGALNVELDMDEAPVAGEYVFVPENPETTFTESRGPESKRSGRLAAPATPTPPGMSEESNHSSWTTSQRAFAKITGHEYQYLPSAGILLDLTLDGFYKAYKWSLYYKDDTYYMIALSAEPGLDKHHGKSFTEATMRGGNPPDPKLCAWHFRQCVQMFVRGYSVQMALNAL
ncbi:hypothetical protein JCM1840_000720 [Sporobolomyces johnsonii]